MWETIGTVLAVILGIAFVAVFGVIIFGGVACAVDSLHECPMGGTHTEVEHDHQALPNGQLWKIRCGKCNEELGTRGFHAPL